MARHDTKTPASSDPAEAVRAFYKRHPYPAPLGNLDRHRELDRNPDRRRALSFLLWPTERPRPNRENPGRRLRDIAGRNGEAGQGLQKSAALADALLHPQDRAYTVPQLYAWLERCGSSFGRWFEQAPYLPQCGVIARMPHTARLARLTPPLQHAAVELLRGKMTKHNFIAYRDDRPGQGQPITFGGDAWRGYVPLRLPWTVCVGDRVPPGSVAVLINRAHTCPDLAFPIDAAQERVFAAIDGKRSIREIMQAAAGAIGDEPARGFIEQLWEYDQIVFDATNSQ
jgi:hypothetical protein